MSEFIEHRFEGIIKPSKKRIGIAALAVTTLTGGVGAASILNASEDNVGKTSTLSPLITSSPEQFRDIETGHILTKKDGSINIVAASSNKVYKSEIGSDKPYTTSSQLNVNAINQVATDPSGQDILVVGSQPHDVTNSVFSSANGGVNWKKVDIPSQPGSKTNQTTIAVNPYNPDEGIVVTEYTTPAISTPAISINAINMKAGKVSSETSAAYNTVYGISFDAKHPNAVRVFATDPYINGGAFSTITYDPSIKDNPTLQKYNLSPHESSIPTDNTPRLFIQTGKDGQATKIYAPLVNSADPFGVSKNILVTDPQNGTREIIDCSFILNRLGNKNSWFSKIKSINQTPTPQHPTLQISAVNFLPGQIALSGYYNAGGENDAPRFFITLWNENTPSQKVPDVAKTFVIKGAKNQIEGIMHTNIDNRDALTFFIPDQGPAVVFFDQQNNGELPLNLLSKGLPLQNDMG